MNLAHISLAGWSTDARRSDDEADHWVSSRGSLPDQAH